MQGIKQLGTSYFVFRGAVHTRFEHSLGTLQKAEQIIQAVNREDRKIDAVGRRIARLAALLHDLPHVPFGHTLEDEFRLLERHDENRARLKVLLEESRVGEVLSSALPGDEYRLLRRVLGLDRDTRKGNASKNKDEAIAKALGEYTYVADIVANTVCADALDYIVRDLSACGMPVAIGDRFLDFFDITPNDAPVLANRNRMALRLDKRGMPRPDVESEIIKLLTYRYELAERVFFHHAKNAASVMIGEAVRCLGLDKHDANFHWLSDDLLLAVLANPKVGTALGLKMSKKDTGRHAVASELGSLIGRRQFFKLAYLGVADDDVDRQAYDIYEKWGKPEGRAELQDELAARAGIEAGRVLVHLPKPDMMAKLAQVRVLLDQDTVVTFEEWERHHAGRVQALNQAHERLWRVAVYLHPEDLAEPATRRLVGSAARDLLGIRSRYAEQEVNQPYLAAVYDLNKDRWPNSDREETIEQAAAAAASAVKSKSLKTAIELIEPFARKSEENAAQEEGRTGGPENPIGHLRT